MKDTIDGRGEARRRFPKAKQNGITAVALVAMLVGVQAKASYAAEPFPKAVLNAESGAFVLPDTGPMRDALRYSLSSGIKSANSISDQIAIGTSDRLHGASLLVAAGDLPFWTLPVGANDAVHTANPSGNSDSSGYIVLAAVNLSARPRESSSGVRYTDTPSHKQSDLVPGSNALTSSDSEPRIYTMMLAGLGLMGFVASRRQP